MQKKWPHPVLRGPSQISLQTLHSLSTPSKGAGTTGLASRTGAAGPPAATPGSGFTSAPAPPRLGLTSWAASAAAAAFLRLFSAAAAAALCLVRSTSRSSCVR